MDERRALISCIVPTGVAEAPCGWRTGWLTPRGARKLYRAHVRHAHTKAERRLFRARYGRRPAGLWR